MIIYGTVEFEISFTAFYFLFEVVSLFDISLAQAQGKKKLLEKFFDQLSETMAHEVASDF